VHFNIFLVPILSGPDRYHGKVCLGSRVWRSRRERNVNKNPEHNALVPIEHMATLVEYPKKIQMAISRLKVRRELLGPHSRIHTFSPGSLNGRGFQNGNTGSERKREEECIAWVQQ
jgi:hypothetical protein